MKVYIVKGDLLFTDYQIDSVYMHRNQAEKRINELTCQLSKDELAENIKEFGFAGWIIDECDLIK